MIRRALLSLLAAGAALSLAACGPGAGAKTEIVFSILSAEDQANFGPYWAPLLADLGKATGTKVTARFSPTYTSLVEGMRAGQVQAGWFSAEPALDAVQRAQGEVFARTVDLQGHDTYNSVIITRKGSPITLAKVLACDKTLSFGMADVKSTSGTLAPEFYLFNPHHIDVNTCFKVLRIGTHQANLFGVSNGLLDASTNNSVGLDFARVGEAAAQTAFNRLQIIWTSPPLPESAIVYRRDLPADLKAKMAAFFTHYGQVPGAEGERQRAIVAKLHYSGFRTADDAYLKPIADMRAAIPAS